MDAETTNAAIELYQSLVSDYEKAYESSRHPEMAKLLADAKLHLSRLESNHKNCTFPCCPACTVKMPESLETIEDITGDIGTVDSDAKYTMFSYERPAYIFWQGFYNQLTQKQNYSHDEAMELMQSKSVRHMLDHSDVLLEVLGEQMAKEFNNI